jgi:hypothetical protein
MFCVVILVSEQKSLKSAEVVFGSSGGGGFSAQPAFHSLCFARPETWLSERVSGQSVIIYSLFDYRE